MSSNNLTEKQIEVMNMLRSVSVDGVSEDMIDEVVQMMDSKKPIEDQKIGISDLEIRMRLMDETDWRKRASLSALLISRGLDN